MIAPHQNQPGQPKAKWTRSLTGLSLLAAMLAAVLLWAAGSRWAGRTPRNTLTVSRTNLVLVAGRLCLSGQTNGFTGLMVEHSVYGSLRSSSAVLNGLLHGLSQGCYTNGQLQVTEHFKKGVSDGLRTKWYASGSKQSEASIVSGQLEGPYRRWHENGVLAEQVEFHQGQAHGLSLSYFPSGSLKARVTLDQGKVIEQKFWKDGEAKDPLSASAVPLAALGTGANAQ